MSEVMNFNNRIIKQMYVWLISFVVVLSLLLSNQAVASYEIQLSQGWNLISLPEQQTNTDIEIVTGSIEDSIISIWNYEDGHWYFYAPDYEGLSDLETMDAGKAYWINTREQDTLVGSGIVPSSSIRLNNGWNFIGYNASLGKNMIEAMSSTGGNVDKVYAYIDGMWKEYPTGDPNELSSMEPERGYWVKTNSPCTLSLDLDISDTTKNINVSLTSNISSITEDKITFEGTSDFIDNLSLGDILALEPCSIAPNGFLRKVTNIERNGNVAIVTTIPASLNEAIQNGAVGITNQLTVDDIDLANSIFGPGAELFSTEEIDFGIRLEQVITDDNGNTITVTGEVVLKPAILVNMQWENWNLEEFLLVFTANEPVYLSVVAQIEILSFDKSV